MYQRENPLQKKTYKALGWASIAIGAIELGATKWLEETMGVEDHEILIRSFGAREVATGVTLLAQPGVNKTVGAGLWGRVVGDAIDLACLSGAAKETTNPGGLATVMAMVLAVTGLDVFAALWVQRDLNQRKADADALHEERYAPRRLGHVSSSR